MTASAWLSKANRSLHTRRARTVARACDPKGVAKLSWRSGKYSSGYSLNQVARPVDGPQLLPKSCHSGSWIVLSPKQNED